MPTFQGHGLYDLLADLLLVLSVVFFVYRFKKYNSLPHLGKQMNILSGLFIWFLFMALPNTMYAFFELKHLIFIDGIADNGIVNNHNIYSYLIFGGISLTGLLATVYLNVLLVSHYAKNNSEMFFYLVLLCLVQCFGAVAGLMDNFSLDGLIFPPVIFRILWQIFNTPNLLATATLASIFLYSLSLPFVNKQIKIS